MFVISPLAPHLIFVLSGVEFQYLTRHYVTHLVSVTELPCVVGLLLFHDTECAMRVVAIFGIT